MVCAVEGRQVGFVNQGSGLSRPKCGFVVGRQVNLQLSAQYFKASALCLRS